MCVQVPSQGYITTASSTQRYVFAAAAQAAYARLSYILSTVWLPLSDCYLDGCSLHYGRGPMQLACQGISSVGCCLNDSVMRNAGDIHAERGVHGSATFGPVSLEILVVRLEKYTCPRLCCCAGE